MQPFEALVRRTIMDGVERTVKNIKQLMEPLIQWQLNQVTINSAKS